MLRSTVLSVRSRWKREIGSFSAEVREQRVGEAEIAFRVLEVDRVDLVRHRARADLAGARALREVAEADVAPGVAAPVDQDRVAALDQASNSSAMRVVRLDLRRVRIEGAGRAGPRRPAARAPPSRSSGRRRDGRCSCRPRRSSSPSSSTAAIRSRAPRPAARRRWRISLPSVVGLAGLAVRAARASADVGVLARHRRAARAIRPSSAGSSTSRARRRQHQRVAGVVDVLAGAGEVDEADSGRRARDRRRSARPASTRPP